MKHSTVDVLAKLQWCWKCEYTKDSVIIKWHSFVHRPHAVARKLWMALSRQKNHRIIFEFQMHVQPLMKIGIG
jgi:hypothetical protein